MHESSGMRSPGRRRWRTWATAAAGVLSMTGVVLGGGGVARAAPDAVYVVQTQGAPMEAGVSIPLRVGVKIGGTEATVDDTPSARGAAMLVDSRATGLVSLLLFGTTADPPVRLPTPTVAEAFWAGGDPTHADAAFVTDPTGQRDDAAIDPRVFKSTARAEPGPWSTGQASYAGFRIPALGLAVSGMASESVADAKGDTVTATTRSVVKRLSLLEGQITLDDIVATAEGEADGTPGGLRADSTFTVGRVTASGTPTELTTSGLTGASPVLDQLAGQGISIRLGQSEKVLDAATSHAAAVSRGLMIRFQPPGAQQAIDFSVGFAAVDISAPPRPTFTGNAGVAVPDERPGGTGPAAVPSSGGPLSTPSYTTGGSSFTAGLKTTVTKPDELRPADLASLASGPGARLASSTEEFSGPMEEAALGGRRGYQPSATSGRRRPGDAAAETEALAMVLAIASFGSAVVLRGLQSLVRAEGRR